MGLAGRHGPDAGAGGRILLRLPDPLNFVNNFSEVSAELVEEIREERKKAERDEELEEEMLGDLSGNLVKINHHGGWASSIVKSMLEHSRTSTGQRQPTDLNALADEYLRLAYHGLRRSGRCGPGQRQGRQRRIRYAFRPHIG